MHVPVSIYSSCHVLYLESISKNSKSLFMSIMNIYRKLKNIAQSSLWVRARHFWMSVTWLIPSYAKQPLFDWELFIGSWFYPKPLKWLKTTIRTRQILKLPLILQSTTVRKFNLQTELTWKQQTKPRWYASTSASVEIKTFRRKWNKNWKPRHLIEEIFHTCNTFSDFGLKSESKHNSQCNSLSTFVTLPI